MSEIPAKVDSAMAAQNYLLQAWDDLSTRDYSRIMRKYGHLGDALNTLRDAVDAANKAIVTDAFAVDDPQPVKVPMDFWLLPPDFGFKVFRVEANDEWSSTIIDANCSLIESSGGVTFYEVDTLGFHTVIHYPAGWYGPIQPVRLSTDQLMQRQGYKKPKRKKRLSEMTDEEHAEAIKNVRDRLDRAEAQRTPKTEAAAKVEGATGYIPPPSANERDEIRRSLAKGEFPPDNLGTDAGGTPITPPERIRDVWGGNEPPEEPKGLPVTDDEHEATLARLRAEADRENDDGQPPPEAASLDPEFRTMSKSWGPEPSKPTALQVNTDGTIPAKQADNPPLPPGAQEWADKAAQEPWVGKARPTDEAPF